MMKFGYARVSTVDQSLDAQVDALKRDGCEMIFEEKVSGARTARPQLDQCLMMLRRDDVLVVTKLDRLGRSLKQLVSLMEEFKERGIAFKCLDDPIDTSSTTGEFFFHVMGAFAQLERTLIKERTRVGLQAARARGRYGGRPESIPADKKELAYELVMANDMPIIEIAKTLGMSRMSVYRIIEKKRARESASAV
jgi:DNA invertase Pin-like site-specific DNA recombinase